MTEPAVSAVAAAVAAKKALELAVSDLYSAAKESIGFTIKKSQVKNKIKRLEAYVAGVCQVKTLWQLDKAVDLNDFYCDSHVLINMQQRRGTKCSCS